MNPEAFEQSKQNGAHAVLARLVGEWQVITRTWFEPGKLADESPSQGTSRPLMDGRFVLHEYEGQLVGQTTMPGLVIHGYNLMTEQFEAVWINNLHMETGMMFSTGQGTTFDSCLL